MGDKEKALIGWSLIFTNLFVKWASSGGAVWMECTGHARPSPKVGNRREGKESPQWWWWWCS